MTRALSIAALVLLPGTVVAAATTYPLNVPHMQRPTLLVHENHPGAAKASGVVNSIDPAQRKLNVSHASIKQLGWPAMTMDFGVSKDVDLSAVKAGMKVNFTLVRGSDGAWTVDTLKPAQN